jgi:hypothetical protein
MRKVETEKRKIFLMNYIKGFPKKSMKKVCFLRMNSTKINFKRFSNVSRCRAKMLRRWVVLARDQRSFQLRMMRLRRVF